MTHMETIPVDTGDIWLYERALLIDIRALLPYGRTVCFDAYGGHYSGPFDTWKGCIL